MEEKISAFKEGFLDIVKLCLEINSVTLQDAVDAISCEMEELTDDGDMEQALSLLDELALHVNDLHMEEYEDVVSEINDLVEDLRNDANCS